MDTLNFLRTFSFSMYLDSIRRYCSTTCLAQPKNSSPSGVTVIPRLVRLKSSTPISFSSSLIDAERLGCVINRLRAASFMDLVSATAMAYFICIKVICEKLLYHSGFNIHTAPLVFLLDKLQANQVTLSTLLKFSFMIPDCYVLLTLVSFTFRS